MRRAYPNAPRREVESGFRAILRVAGPAMPAQPLAARARPAHLIAMKLFHRIAAFALTALILGGCLAQIPGDNVAEMKVEFFPPLGPDERDFDSPCRHFGNETPFSDRPVHQC